MEPVENKNAFKAKGETQIDRVILCPKESMLVQKWVESLNARADGLIRFTKSDVVNFLLNSHPAKWEAAEIAALATQCFEETRWLSWSMGKLKAARKMGTSLNFEELTKFRDELLGGAAKKLRKTKTTDDTSRDNDSANASSEI